jgi:ABC-type amino acid transport substrate-binding protein
VKRPICSLFLFLMMLAGCGGMGAPVPSRLGADVTQIRVAIAADHPPYAYLSTDGQPAGSDVDLARDLAERTGVKIEWVDQRVSRIAGMVGRGRVDLAVVSVKSVDELNLPANAEDRNYWIACIFPAAGGDVTYILVQHDDFGLVLAAALGQMRDSGVTAGRLETADCPVQR